MADFNIICTCVCARIYAYVGVYVKLNLKVAVFKNKVL